MTLFILTCINEDLEIVNQSVHTNFLDAGTEMNKEFRRERSAMVVDNGEDYIIEDEVFATSATLVYGDAPYQYEWKIRMVEA